MFAITFGAGVQCSGFKNICLIKDVKRHTYSKKFFQYQLTFATQLRETNRITSTSYIKKHWQKQGTVAFRTIPCIFSKLQEKAYLPYCS